MLGAGGFCLYPATAILLRADVSDVRQWHVSAGSHPSRISCVHIQAISERDKQHTHTHIRGVRGQIKQKKYSRQPRESLPCAFAFIQESNPWSGDCECYGTIWLAMSAQAAIVKGLAACTLIPFLIAPHSRQKKSSRLDINQTAKVVFSISKQDNTNTIESLAKRNS